MNAAIRIVYVGVRKTVETLGADPKACVYLDDPRVNSNPAHEMSTTAIQVLNAAQAIAELEMTGLVLRSLLEKNTASEWELLTPHPKARQAFRKVHLARVNSSSIRPARFEF
jgi:hypothetical protein